MTRMIRLSLLPLLSSLLLAACAGEIELESTRDGVPETRPGLPGEDLQAFIRESGVSCEGDCPEYVAGLYTVEQSWGGAAELSACSGTLVGPDLLLTNRHCLPENVVYSGASCLDNIHIVFPRTHEFPQQKIKCQSVVAVSPDRGSVAAPDWAILRLETQPRRPVAPRPAKPSGVGLDAPVSMYSVDFALYESRPERRGVLREIKCVANTNGVRTLSHIGSFSRLFDVTDCTAKVKGGFSGSGVFNSSGHLVGLLSWAINIEDGTNADIQKLRERYPGLPQHSGGGTTVACIEGLLRPGQELPKDCAFPSVDKYLSAAESFYKRRSQERHAEMPRLREEVMTALMGEDDLRVEWIFNDSTALGTEDGPALVEAPLDQVVAAWGLQTPFDEILAVQWFGVAFPVIPKCVRPEKPEHDFAVSLYRLVPEIEESVDRKRWRITYPSEVTNHRALLRWFDDHYIWTVQAGLHVRIPLCSELTSSGESTSLSPEEDPISPPNPTQPNP